jgi:triosephosphate isomerase
MRIPLFAANWKMHKTVQEAVGYVRELGALVRTLDRVEVVVAPPFTSLAAAAEAARNTGEVSAGMVKDAGAHYAIVGHSERRRLFGETDEWVNRKARAAIGVGLGAIVCVGETLEEREAGQTLAVLDRQLGAALVGLTSADVAALVVAYEPVWAIGTGRNATAAEAGEAHRHIRERLTAACGAEAALKCRLLYGGSVKPDNIAELAALPDVDGALVGGASLAAQTFFEIITHARR